MSNKKPYRSIDSASRPLRPGQDIKVVRKQASQFPALGVSLGNYKQDRSYGIDRPSKLNLAPKREGRGRFKGILRGITLKRSVIVLLLLVLLTGGWVGGKFIYNAHKIFGGNIFSILTTTKLQGESNGRVTILLAGNSVDDVGHQGAQLTDSILILSVDTKNNTAFILSVPRDLWVNIPGSGYQKINDAYVVGQTNNFSQNGYFKGGMGQLQQIIEQDFGIPINYYALIDYSALRDAVNAVGGITINIQSSDPRGLYDPSIDYSTGGPLVKLTNGVHYLDGQQALDLARARGDAYGSYGFPDSDFDRTEHQRQMLVALKEKAVSAGVLSNPARLSSLSDAIGNNVTTDFTLSEVHRLYDLVKPISSSSIESLSLNDDNGKNLLASYVSSNGEEALIPAAGVDDFNIIQQFVNQQLSSNPVIREGATVVVLNATDTTGLASQERSTLTSRGIDVTAIGDSSTNQTTTIINNSNNKKPATLQYLEKTFGNSVTATNPYSNIYQADFIVILGSNLTGTATTTSN